MSSPAISHHPSAFSDIHLGIVCPMANEEASVVRFVNLVLAECAPAKFRSVTFFASVDDASTDRTRELLNMLKEQTPQLQIVCSPSNRTVVDAYLRGYEAALNAGCDWILEIDAGFSHQPSEIPRFFEKMRAGYDCVFGSRFCAGGAVADNTLARKIVSHGGSVLANLVLGTTLKDMTSGFEMFTHEALRTVLERGIKSRGPFFQTEIKAYCRNMNIVEIPIHYRVDGTNINRRTLHDSFLNLGRLFTVRLRGKL